MGLYSNPLAYTGYHPQVTGTPFVTNSTVRAATQEEVDEGLLDFCYVSPVTLSSSIISDLSSPPPIGDVDPNTIAATTLTSTGNVSLATDPFADIVSILSSSSGIAPTASLRIGNSPTVNLIDIGNVTTTGNPRFIRISGGSQVQDDFVFIQGGFHSAGTQLTRINSDACTGGTQTVTVLSGNYSGGTQSLLLMSGTSSGGTQSVRMGASTTLIGFFGRTPAAQPTNTTDLRTALLNLGLVAPGGANPLNLNGGAFTSSTVTTDEIRLPCPSVSGASPIINNSRTGQVSFSDSIVNGTFGTLTMTNSTFTPSAVIQATISCATVNSAVMITKINLSAGSCDFTVYNAGSATTLANIIINFSRLD